MSYTCTRNPNVIPNPHVLSVTEREVARDMRVHLLRCGMDQAPVGVRAGMCVCVCVCV